MPVKKIVKKLVPHFLLDWYHLGMAFLGALVFRFPSRKLIVIGVTGTSGKSSTVDFISRILEASGKKVASASTVRFKIGDKERKNNLKMTMPGRFAVQQFLRQAVSQKCQYAVIEVTSEGIRQHRHRFIHFNTAVFTNLTPEHIESHGGFENYRTEKLKLFKATKNIHVLNLDDTNINFFVEIPAEKKYTFGIKNSDADVRAEEITASQSGLAFKVQDMGFTLQVLGQFNVYNALAAICVAKAQGISLEVCRQALAGVQGIPGRMEVVSREPLVVVDYAHTPEQLENVYKSFKGKKLICVLGSCGGGRDKWKRPVLGKLAQQYCQEIVITNEDPYDEDPLEIMQQVAGGIDPDQQPNHYRMVMDRKEAIQGALAMAKAEDAVIITGKGSETLMCLANGKKIDWSDAQIAKEALAQV